MEIWPKLLTQHFFQIANVHRSQPTDAATNAGMKCESSAGRRNDGKRVLKYATIICICNIYINLHQVMDIYLFLFSDVSRKGIPSNSFQIGISYRSLHGH